MSWLDFLKPQKNYPEFWQKYLAAFNTKKPEYFVAFDCETTGLNPAKDSILSIGAVKFTTERIFIKQNKEWFLKQSQDNDESVKIHGILPSSSSEATLFEEKAIEYFLKYIGAATLVGHHINFDVCMINNALKRLGAGKLKNTQKDTNSIYKQKGHFAHEQNFSLDELSETYNITTSNRHTALGDAYITAQIFQRLSYE
jgi:DNA polymerase-3 subunit epsilon